MKKNVSGYTLVELMIALILGLIVIAAGIQLLIGGQKSLLFQSAVADVQDNANIGINYIVSDIHHANLNLPYRAMLNNRISGLVVSDANFKDPPSSGSPLIKMDGAIFSESEAGPSFTNIKSDILVIQYRPVVARGYDCEGNLITSVNDVIVQRYFLRVDKNSPNEDLALACDAGRYAFGTGTEITGLDGSGQIIMPRVDQFKVLIGVINGDQMAYMTPKQFADNTVGARAVSLQIGVLVRSVDNSSSNTQENNQFELLNEAYKLAVPDNVQRKYLRIPVEQTIAFRNALGDAS